MNAWAQGEAALKGEIPTWSIFGWHVQQIGYQGTVLPVLAAIWFLSVVEKWLRKRMPTVLDMLFTPLVITGLHHSFHAVELGMLSDPSVHANPLLPIWSMSNVAQGAAALAAYLLIRRRATKIKDIAIPSSVSAFLGITEPAIYGVNLRLLTPFIGALIGGGFAGAWVVATDVTMTSIGATGIPGIALVTPAKIPQYLIGMVISVAVSMAATIAITKVRGFAKEAEAEMNEEEVEEVALDRAKQLDALP